MSAVPALPALTSLVLQPTKTKRTGGRIVKAASWPPGWHGSNLVKHCCTEGKYYDAEEAAAAVYQ
jgi:hypothetical protein